MEKINFKTAYMYPFNRARGMWNILWFFVPVVGWFALGGYGVRIIKEFSRGKFKELPMLDFSSDLKLGFFMFIKALPFVIVYMIVAGTLSKMNSGLGGLINFFLAFFVAPILGVNFMNKETVNSLFEFRIVKSVFNNLGDYVTTMLKSMLLGLIFALMMIILVGIPAGAFTKNIFLADFYRRRVK